MPNLIGQSLGRYHILEQLGEGGMATVYKAYDTRLERDVAVKVILPVKQQSEISLKRFEREAKALAQLTYPNIVHINDFGEQDGIPYLVMDYLPGGTLKQRLGKPMPWNEAVKLLLPVARALEYAHKRGIIHRDVKPSNILISADNEPRLTDFGVAKILQSEGTVDLTGTGYGIGTPEYMAPEQFQGAADEKIDIYALGVVFYEMVAGRKPYLADTPAAIIIKQATENLPRPTKYVRELPQEVERILFKALAKDARHRYQSMGDFVQALEKLLTQMPSTRRSSRHIPSWAWIIGGLVIIGSLVSTFARQSLTGKLAESTEITATTPLITGMVGEELTATPTITSTQTLLTSAPGIGGGSGLLFFYRVSQEDDQVGEYTLSNLLTSQEQVFFSHNCFGFVAWSPDGTQLIYSVAQGDGTNCDLFRINTDGSGLLQLTHDLADDYDPSWSPDGEYVVFISNRGGTDDIFRIHPDGTDLKRLTSDPSDELYARWSPDSKELTYMSEEDGDFEIYIIDAETGAGKRNVTNNDARDRYPSWSPDGERIAFHSDLNGNMDVYSINIDGTDLQQLTDDPASDAAAIYSPDGSLIAFHSDRSGNWDIYLMHPDGSGLERLTFTEQDELFPSWQPYSPGAMELALLPRPTPARLPTLSFLPTPELLAGSIVQYSDTFDIDRGDWYLSTQVASVVEGVIHLEGNRTYDGGIWNTQLVDGQGVLLAFSCSPDVAGSIFLESGAWDTIGLRRWGIECAGDGDLTILPSVYFDRSYIGGDFVGNLDPQYNNWYALLLVLGDDNNFLARVWDPENPELFIEMNSTMDPQWIGKTWQMFIEIYEGSMEIDNFQVYSLP